MELNPPRAFAITAKSGTLLLDAVGSGRADFTVTNSTQTTSACRAIVEPLGNAKQEWFSVADRVERNLDAGTSTQFTVVTRVPPGTTAGTYQFRLDIFSESDGGTRDDIQVQGPTVVFEIKATTPVPIPLTWWQRNWRWVLPMASAAMLLLVTGVVVAQVRSSRAAAERTRLAELEAEQRRLADEAERTRLAKEKADEDEKIRIAKENAANEERIRILREEAIEDEKRKAREMTEESERKRIAKEKATEDERIRIAREKSIEETQRLGERITKVQLTAKTGTVRGAGTDANVFLRFVSEKDNAEAAMPDLAGNETESGDTNTYPWVDLGGDVRLATLRDVVLRHDDSKSGSGWYVAHVTVKVTTSRGRELTIVDDNCNCWLATDEGDRRIERSLKRK